ncbi:MAG: hypothetical protein DLM68_07370, partial [Hyphomicrobiales bacterium]
MGKSYLAGSFSQASGHFKAAAANLSRNSATILTRISRIARFFAAWLGRRARYVLTQTISALSGARCADVARFRAREPHVEGLALSQSVESGNLRRDKAVIRWMSVQMRLMASGSTLT